MKNSSHSSNPIIVETDDRSLSTNHHPVCIVLDNLRSAYNVGNIFRLADVCLVQKIITCGYTAAPPHPKLKKTARGCDEIVEHQHFSTSVEAVKALNKAGYQTIAVETIKGAANIWDITFQFPTALVFGNEALGISADTLQCCTDRARLPVYGKKNSLNVANCAAVAVYTALRQL